MIVFNCSLPRAGSELLQQVIHQRDDFYASRTDGILELIYGARNNFTELPEFRSQDPDVMDAAFTAFCKAGVIAWADSLRGDLPNICLKSRGISHWFEWFEQFMGEKPKIVCMVRDLRSIFASMEKNYRNKRNLHPQEDSPAEMAGITVIDRVSNWARSQPVGLAVARLKGTLDRGVDKHILFIRYEDFVQNPQKEMSKVYKYFGVSDCKHDFNNLPDLPYEHEGFYGIYGDHTLRESIEKRAPDYFDVLGRDICQDIVASNLWFYKKFYPEKV